MGELRTSTGDAAMDKARSRVVNKDEKENIIDEGSNLGVILALVALYT